MFPIAHQQPSWDGFADGVEEEEPYSSLEDVSAYWLFWHGPLPAEKRRGCGS